MREVVSLAAALALPSLLMDGNPFPQRNIIVFLAFCITCITLILQGLTLPHLIRGLKLAGATEPSSEEQGARRIMIDAAARQIKRR
jgi:CPA1 family monovalent cation:H+ antiporter